MGKLAEIKTKQNNASVEDFMDSITDAKMKEDGKFILSIMEKAMQEKPKMWGSSLIGFGKLIYKSPATGREVEWFKIGFSPRKSAMSLHLMNLQQHEAALANLGKFKSGAGCLYIKKLEDVDKGVLEEIIMISAKSNLQ